MTGGIVVGGWGFVIAAYSLTAIAFLIYGVTLITKLRDEQSRAGAEGNQE
jgi:hypothetical protein